jgi:hypothetical protein
MKKKNIKNTIARAAVYSRTLTRVKHYRGAGVHSPFVYGVIRNAMMKTTPEGDNHPLFDELRRRGFSRRRASQLQNLYTFLDYTSAPFVEQAGDSVTLDASTLCFVMPTLHDEATEELVAKAAGTGCTLCVVSPYGSRARHKLARSLVAEHRHTSVDNRGFLLLFFNPRLPKQHFKL